MKINDNIPVGTPQTLIQAIRYFEDPENALNYLVKLRWPNGVSCPRCGSAHISFVRTRRIWKCLDCPGHKQFSAKIGTIMEESPLPLDKWLVAIWLEANSKNSISSYELHRAVGITQKSAWFVLHRVRAAVKNGSLEKMGNSGPVEADETYVGGLSKNMHVSRRRKTIYGALGGKTPVMGLLERHGDKPSQVRAQVVKSGSRADLHPIIHKNVEPGATIYTDALPAYRQLAEQYVHDFVDHTEAYVKGAVHTNGLENFWCLFKRCIRGTHVSVDPVHLDAYVDSEAFRFNNRKLNDGGRFARVVQSISGKRLTYRALTGQEQPGALS
jgi:transposase-like protein